MENRYESLVEKAVELGAAEAKLIDTDQVVFDPRSHLKCRFGCNRWGRFWTCPPHLSISQEMFMEGFEKYEKAIVLKTTDPKVGQEVAVTIEKEAMLNHDCGFAFALGSGTYLDILISLLIVTAHNTIIIFPELTIVRFEAIFGVLPN